MEENEGNSLATAQRRYEDKCAKQGIVPGTYAYTHRMHGWRAAEQAHEDLVLRSERMEALLEKFLRKASSADADQIREALAHEVA